MFLPGILRTPSTPDHTAVDIVYDVSKRCFSAVWSEESSAVVSGSSGNAARRVTKDHSTWWYDLHGGGARDPLLKIDSSTFHTNRLSTIFSEK